VPTGPIEGFEGALAEQLSCRLFNPMTVEPIEPVMRVLAFGGPSRRSRWSTCPSTCEHLPSIVQLVPLEEKLSKRS
jgi:hypothetical protein